jgi:hypothetical protein
MVNKVRWPRLIREVKFLGPLPRSIRRIERRLFKKNNYMNIYTGNCETNPLSLINPSLEIGYCSTMLSNHDIIRLVRFISKIKVRVVE